MLKSKRARESAKKVFELGALEKRLLFSAAAKSVHAPHAIAAAATPLSVLTKAQRQDLLNHFDSTNKATLQGLLDANKPGAFDTQLLSYMLTRSGPSFFYDSSNVSNYASYITGHFDVTGTIGNADDIVNHLFPEQTNATSNTIQLAAGDIDWATQPASTNNPEFLHSLNRHGYWLDLSQAYSFTGDPKYVTELTSELASWSTQNPPLADINSWRTTDPKWWLEDTSIRAQTWTWSYFQLLGT